MRGQWPRALLLLALVQPSLQGKFLKAALAAVGSGGFRLLPMFLPIPIEERMYYPVHYFLPVPYEERLHTRRNVHKVHHHHKMLIPVHRRTHKVVHKHHGRVYGHGKKQRRNHY
ncbi:uncharacterized protein LOC119449757 [Dermacentor silvarum]|uniref:uncharacterized protein LOC119449757 n=1 Tax=Dermacentor silvarum TaxID=543639 RepID=UPI00189707B2|nr:uncharacterized protein LOC119449757 [Dermacentor silvarum]XP_049524346.1 uncharacterized protein LOC119449757 [Dermacentor silvarum]